MNPPTNNVGDSKSQEDKGGDENEQRNVNDYLVLGQAQYDSDYTVMAFINGIIMPLGPSGLRDGLGRSGCPPRKAAAPFLLNLN